MCGLLLDVEGGKVGRVRPDPEDPFSQGYMCVKALGLPHVHDDPERVRRPLRRVGTEWQEIGWDEAIDEAVDRLHRVRRRWGNDSVAFYHGNPNLHSYAATLTELDLADALGTRQVYSTASMDHLPHLLASWSLFGHQALLPVPDIDRTQLLVVVGANPVVSNGSLMTAPGFHRRIRALHERGGRLVVVDPRRTETARLADRHLAVRPGGDAFWLASLVHTLFAEGLVRPGRLEGFITGMDALARAVEAFPPERTAARSGIAAADVRQLARELAEAPSAAMYGRLGACTQELGGLAAWLLVATNILTGNLDRPGGSMFPSPATDLARVAAVLGRRGSFGGWRSRVRGLPEFGGELPVSVLAEEMDTPGDNVRALVTSAGNPVLSTPNGARLERALPDLDTFVAVDFYINETTRHAHLILPPASPLERDHYDLLFSAFAVRNVARYDPPVFEPPASARHDWQIHLALVAGLGRRQGGLRGWGTWLRSRLTQAFTPRRVLDLLLRVGPHRGISVRRLLHERRTVDLGPLTPRLPGALYTEDRRIRLAPREHLEHLARLEDAVATTPPTGLVLIGRRILQSNNSWMHHVPALRKGADPCVLLVHPSDAATRNLVTGGRARVCSRVGEVVVPVHVTEDISPGVVSLPHGYGHTRPGVRIGLAVDAPGVSLNDLTDELRVDPFSGVAAFSGVPVTVTACEDDDPVSADPS